MIWLGCDWLIDSFIESDFVVPSLAAMAPMAFEGTLGTGLKRAMKTLFFELIHIN
jgi:hypothetical protein